MHSPLPDSSALEAGILEDELPSGISRVQENVRNLLRNSRFSIASTPQASPRVPLGPNLPWVDHGLATPPTTPLYRMPPQPEVLASPSAESTTSGTSTSPSGSASASPPPLAVPGILFPPVGYQRAAYQSAVFNSRAVAALDHPDLSDPSMAVYVQQKAETRQQRAWRKSKHGRRGRAAVHAGSSQVLLCVLSALLLAAIVATYVVLATSTSNVTATFHILFVLGICLATIVFAHTVVRLFVSSRRARTPRGVLIFPASRGKHNRRHQHHHHHHHGHGHHRTMPSLSNDANAFVPESPIRVHMPTDEVRPDSRDAQPTASVSLGVAVVDWDKDIEALPNPPPAYGRWRGSVRANPDLLHWQPIPSPIDEQSHELPSPTYEEAVSAERTGPPSYVTRESPARQREVREAGAEIDVAAAQAQTARVEDAEPEMVEGRGIGFAA